MQLVDALDNPLRTGDENDAPTGHGIGFRNTVDDDDTLLQFRELGDALVATDVVDVLIDFVGNDIDLLVASQYGSQSGQLLFAIDRAGGVRG